MITIPIKKKIEKIVNVFETGSQEGKYDSLVKYKDYTDPETKSTIVQITYGRSQTTEFGNLRALSKLYIEQNGIYKTDLQTYFNKIGNKPSLATNSHFCQLLKSAARTDNTMKACQNDFFDSYYYLPALGWFNQMGFKLPLSLLVIYDSFIHSGGILSFLRQRFPEKPPVRGGDEKKWIAQYVAVRNAWPASHKKTILQKTVYRTNCFQSQIKKNNWDLSEAVNANRIMVL